MNGVATRVCIALLLGLTASLGGPQVRAGQTGLLFDDVYLRHLAGVSHPERPERLTAIRDGLERAGLTKGMMRIMPRRVTDAELLLVHTRSYVDLVRRELSNLTGPKDLSTGDTVISQGSLETAQFATGGVLNAVDAVMTKKVKNSFCAVRPPGHHASPSRGMGFCIFNNIAIGARHAQRRYGVDRVLIADFDVHHGNGTQEVFWSDGSVLFFDTHQHPWYPGTGLPSEQGEGKGRGLIMNNPFPSGSGRKEIVGAFPDALLPAAERFKPQLVMVSAGFDSRKGDTLWEVT